MFCGVEEEKREKEEEEGASAGRLNSPSCFSTHQGGAVVTSWSRLESLRGNTGHGTASSALLWRPHSATARNGEGDKPQGLSPGSML